jgi:hypothetical protein
MLLPSLRIIYAVTKNQLHAHYELVIRSLSGLGSLSNSEQAEY